MEKLLRVKGIVQGVGFRPFVYRLAKELNLQGWVLNDSDGVLTKVAGSAENIGHFQCALISEAPPMALVESVTEEQETASELEVSVEGFRILPSPAGENHQVLISPDLATCPECRQELLEAKDRRYGYAFINCTNCGPRYSIIRRVPYDRPYTTMAGFTMCPVCQAEYDDPANRRFHAQPNACGVCGPRYELKNPSGDVVSVEDSISQTQKLLRQGRIVAVKGIGGYHLVCDACNEEAVERLRQRKHRYAKPLAVMCGSLARAKELCHVSTEEARLLTSAAAPIVLLAKQQGEASGKNCSDQEQYSQRPLLAEQVAPANAYLGVMLPYAPIHYLLLGSADVFVMTSANFSEEPIIYQDEAAINGLAGVADYFLVHNREIAHRVDDSVVRVVDGRQQLIRRSRGFCPAPVKLQLKQIEKGQRQPTVLAAGAELKNTFCLTKEDKAFVSEHIGDLANMAVYKSYQDIQLHYAGLLNATPELVACDLHPTYLASKYAREYAQRHKLTLVEVQHHHAHIAAVLGEHAYEGKVIGIALDGTGYGADGKIWGGEFLLANAATYRRAAHLTYVPLPGGDKAAQEPWRLAMWLLGRHYGSAEELQQAQADFCSHLPAGWQMVLQAAAKGLNAPLTSSMGRYFDAAGALLDVCYNNQYEGQAAIQLEQLAWQAAKSEAAGRLLPFAYLVQQSDEGWEIDLSPAFVAMAQIRADIHLSEAQASVSLSQAAYRFHLTICCLVTEMAEKLRQQTGIMVVALAGGVWQNRLLLELSQAALQEKGFRVLLNKQLPLNDGAISYGQAVAALARFRLE